MAAIHAAAFPEPERWGADSIAIQLGLPGTFGWLEPTGGMIVCRHQGEEAEILTLAVDPSCRRRGIGSALLRTAMSQAACRGVERIFLEVSERNTGARALYAAYGFHVVGRRRAYYQDGSDALVLRADLIACAATGG